MHEYEARKTATDPEYYFYNNSTGQSTWTEPSAVYNPEFFAGESVARTRIVSDEENRQELAERRAAAAKKREGRETEAEIQAKEARQRNVWVDGRCSALDSV